MADPGELELAPPGEAAQLRLAGNIPLPLDGDRELWLVEAGTAEVFAVPRGAAPLYMQVSVSGHQLALQEVSATGDEPFVFGVPAEAVGDGDATIEFRARRMSGVEGVAGTGSATTDARFSVAFIGVTMLRSSSLL